MGYYIVVVDRVGKMWDVGSSVASRSIVSTFPTSQSFNKNMIVTHKWQIKLTTCSLH